MIASCLNLGAIHEKNDQKKSESFYHKALKLCQQTGDKNREAFVYCCLGDLAAAASDEKNTEALFVKSLELSRKTGDEEQEILARIKLIEWFEKQNQKEKALECLSVAEVFFRNPKAPLQGKKQRLQKEVETIRERWLAKAWIPERKEHKS